MEFWTNYMMTNGNFETEKARIERELAKVEKDLEYYRKREHIRRRMMLYHCVTNRKVSASSTYPLNASV